MSDYFIKAKPIWAKDKLHEVNCSLYFKTTFKQGSYDFVITSNNNYRIILNGEQIGCGPARAAHNYFRVDHYILFGKKANNILVIEVNGVNSNGFYVLNQEPFLQAELLQNGEVIKHTGKSFKIFVNEFRYRKVVRFSFQRTFSESYKIDNKTYQNFFKKSRNEFPQLKHVILKQKLLLARGVDYPTYEPIKYKKVEGGTISLNPNKKPYDNRYMRLDYLVLFDPKEWEIDTNKAVSSFEPKKTQIKPILTKFDFITYANPVSLTGFINLKIDVKEDAVIYIYFDEVNTAKNKSDLIEISFSRNDTHNLVTYELTKGKYNLISFEPYTAKYIRVVVLSGEAKINSVNIIKYENSNAHNLKFNFANKKIQKVLEAAVNTFAHNAVDVLTDCPSRERAGWLCDSYHSGKAEQVITGDNKVEKNFLENYALFNGVNLPKGMVPCCYPSEVIDGMFIPQWSLWYINEIKDYEIRTGDTSVRDISVKNIKGILSYFAKFENSDGLLENLEGWRFVEWSIANDEAYVCGVNYPSNMLYYQALISASYLLNDESLLAKALKIKETIIKQSFNGEFFIDNAVRNEKNELVPTDHTSETCQYYAFYYGVATKEKFEKLYKTMVNKFGPFRDYENVYPKVGKSNVLPGDILRLGVLNRYGDYKHVLKEAIGYFYNMSLLTGTLWEHDFVFASLNHGFTSYIVNLIFEANFGLVKIDKLHKQIILNQKGLYLDSEVEIPLEENDKLILKASNGKFSYTLPKNYSIQTIK